MLPPLPTQRDAAEEQALYQHFLPPSIHTLSEGGTDTKSMLLLFMPPETPNGIRLLYDREIRGASKKQDFCGRAVEILDDEEAKRGDGPISRMERGPSFNLGMEKLELELPIVSGRIDQFEA